MQSLQSVGVPAGIVQRSSDLLADKQYDHRGFYQYLDHEAMGHIPYAGHQYKIRGYDNGPRGPAPMLGQHSFEVLAELGLADEEIAQAYATGVIN
jgi:crotonobetainyl-CoA:carnitine CoA-transferase CaiB-like acyl-CoA transferase